MCAIAFNGERETESVCACSGEKIRMKTMYKGKSRRHRPFTSPGMSPGSYCIHKLGHPDSKLIRVFSCQVTDLLPGHGLGAQGLQHCGTILKHMHVSVLLDKSFHQLATH